MKLKYSLTWFSVVLAALFLTASAVKAGSITLTIIELPDGQHLSVGFGGNYEYFQEDSYPSADHWTFSDHFNSHSLDPWKDTLIGDNFAIAEPDGLYNTVTFMRGLLTANNHNNTITGIQVASDVSIPDISKSSFALIGNSSVVIGIGNGPTATALDLRLTFMDDLPHVGGIDTVPKVPDATSPLFLLMPCVLAIFAVDVRLRRSGRELGC